jgi:hypothetical protein
MISHLLLSKSMKYSRKHSFMYSHKVPYSNGKSGMKAGGIADARLASDRADMRCPGLGLGLLMLLRTLGFVRCAGLMLLRLELCPELRFTPCAELRLIEARLRPGLGLETRLTDARRPPVLAGADGKAAEALELGVSGTDMGGLADSRLAGLGDSKVEAVDWVK